MPLFGSVPFPRPPTTGRENRDLDHDASPARRRCRGSVEITKEIKSDGDPAPTQARCHTAPPPAPHISVSLRGPPAPLWRCHAGQPHRGLVHTDRSGIGSFFGSERLQERRRPTNRPTQPNPAAAAARVEGEEGIGGDGDGVREDGREHAGGGAAGRLSALLSLLALRRLLAVLQPLALLLLLPFRWRARPGTVAVAVASDAAASASGASGKKGGKASASVVLRVPAGSPMVAARRQASARREIAIRRAGGRSGVRTSLFLSVSFEIMLWLCCLGCLDGSGHSLDWLCSGRYDHLARRLNEIGIKVYGMDWTGHGGSDALHGYVQSLDHAVNDLKMYLKKVLAENPGLPCFCFGHSTGGGIILKAALDPEVETLISHGASCCSPRAEYQFPGSQKNGPPVSRDPEALRTKYSDPLVFTGAIRVRTGYEILRLTSYLQQHLHRDHRPHPGAPRRRRHGDRPPTGSRPLYEQSSSADKSLKLYSGLLHDLLIEPEKDKVMDDIVAWLSPRV
ncbi:hypothetical protein HU200_047700 [Digitaria exilis]|uniref:Serine aminopeptidase S33 domain-containing protein n=1 Tax=Digitaria exilis TaxID=1010633 RepID=A0A835E883_9POAL|nr:hypothetical protein HU200_047700 [Digitaria exilis]